MQTAKHEIIRLTTGIFLRQAVLLLGTLDAVRGRKMAALTGGSRSRFEQLEACIHSSVLSSRSRNSPPSTSSDRNLFGSGNGTQSRFSP